MTIAIHTEGLQKTYRGGNHPALGGIDLAVPAGTVYGLLGPNGAGKTTAVRILTTLLRPGGGRAVVAGFDVAREPGRVRRQIGLVGQHAAVDELLTGRQNLVMFGRLHHLSTVDAHSRARALLDRFDLAEAADKAVGQFSGGMRRRLDLAASLILAPKVLFLDEPTAGLDPRGRGEVWAAVRGLVAAGTTVLLTTQYLDEADQLANRIAVLDHGRIVADGRPDELKAALGGDRLEVVLHDTADLAAAAGIIGRVCGVEPDIDTDLRRVSAAVADRVTALTEAVRLLAAAGIVPQDIVVRRPTLDEVFLDLVGTRKETMPA